MEKDNEDNDKWRMLFLCLVFFSVSPSASLHNALLWYMTTLHSRLQRIHTVRKSQSAASTKPMEFGMRIFQSSKNTKQCTKCSETFKYVSIKKIHWVLLSFLCQENETFLNFQLLWNMHGNFEGLRSITTFGLPRIHKIHKIKKIVKFTKKKKSQN